MARLKSQDHSDEELPDLATLLRRPKAHTSSLRASTTTPKCYQKLNQHDEAFIAKHASAAKTSTLVPKMKPAESSARRQRPLKSLHNINSQSAPLESRTKCLKQDQGGHRMLSLQQSRQTPRRVAKTAANYRPCTPPSSEESEVEENETTWCNSDEGDEINDTVIEDDFSDLDFFKSPHKPGKSSVSDAKSISLGMKKKQDQ